MSEARQKPSFPEILMEYLRQNVAAWKHSMKEGQSPPSRLTLFSLVFAWANLLHLVSYSEWIRDLEPIEWLSFLVNVGLAIRPSAIRLFFASVVLRILYTAYWVPMLRGHLFLEGLFTVGIAVALGFEVWKLRKTRSFDAGEQERLFESFAPYLRVTCLLVYAAVTLSKLNTEFIDPQKSAAVQLLFWTADFYAWIPTGHWAQQVTIWGTLIFEAGIPILLCFRRTLWLGLVLGLAFHSVLAVIPLKIASFTLTMCILLAAWLPRESPKPIFTLFHRLVRATRLSPLTFVLLIGVLAGTTGLLYAVTTGPLVLKRGVLFIGLGIWWWQTAILFLALWSIRKVKGEGIQKLLRVPSRVLQLYLVFILFNWLCPYLGLKTRSALSMHCNLRTEPGYWNHLFLPESMRVFTYQDALIEIVESDLPDLDHLRKEGMPLPFFEFRRWCRLAEDDFFVIYKDRDGNKKRFEKREGEGSDAALMYRSRILEWFLCFNPAGASHDYIPGLVRRTGPPRNVVPSYEVPK